MARALEACRRVAELHAEKERLGEALRKVNLDLDLALGEAEREMVEAGLPRLPIDGKLLYWQGYAQVVPRLGRDGPPRPPRTTLPEEARAALYRAMSRMGIAELMPRGVNTRALQGWIVEQVEDGHELPEAFTHWFDYATGKQLRVRNDQAGGGGASVKDKLDAALGGGK